MFISISALLLLLLLAMVSRPAHACFNRSICQGDTPRVDPESYFCLIRANMRYKLNNPVFAQFIDKVLFKEFCRLHNVPTARMLAVYNQSNYRKVDLLKYLPSYVVKSNKGSGNNLVFKNGSIIAGAHALRFDADLHDPLYRDRVHAEIKHWGRQYSSTEKQYEYIQPKIFIEEFLEPFPDDIKVFVVNGTVDLIQIRLGLESNFYDAGMNNLPYVRGESPNFNVTSVADELKADPKKLRNLIRLSELFAAAVPLDIVRVDWFMMGGVLYGGEITLSPNGGNDFIQLKSNPREPVLGYRNMHECAIPYVFGKRDEDKNRGAVFSIPLPGRRKGCFNRTVCSGETPKVDPEFYFCLVRSNMRLKLDDPSFVKFVDRLRFKDFCRSQNVPVANTLAVYSQSDYEKVDLLKYYPSFAVKSNKGSLNKLVFHNGTMVSGREALKEGADLHNVSYRQRVYQELSSWGHPYSSTQRQFEYVKPKIYIEEYLPTHSDEIVKVYVINGKADLIQFNKAGDVAINFFDIKMRKLPYVRHGTPSYSLSKTNLILRRNATKLSKLIRHSESFARSVPINLVRVDWYMSRGDFYGREIVLSPNGGNDYIQHVSNERDPLWSPRNVNTTCPVPFQHGKLEDQNIRIE